MYLTKYSLASSTSPFLCVNLTSQDILSHPWHLHFYLSTWPKYSCPSSTPQFLRSYSTKIFFAYPWHLNFYVSTQPNYPFPSLTSTFLSVYSTKKFFCIPETSISTYILDQNVLLHPRHLHFYLFTWPKYSCASPTPTFLRIYLTKIFLRIPDTSISMYLLTQNIFVHPCHLPSTYLFDQNILAHPGQLNFYASWILWSSRYEEIEVSRRMRKNILVE